MIFGFSGYHSENIDKVADDLIDSCLIEPGVFDYIADAKYASLLIKGKHSNASGVQKLIWCVGRLKLSCLYSER